MMRRCLFTAMGLLLLPAGLAGQDNTRGFIEWAAARAVRLRTVEPGGPHADLQPLRSIIGAARVVSLGEPAHGAHEPLAARNRLFRYLVEELGFTAIVLESGLAESKRIHDFVAGGEGTAEEVAQNLTWGFNVFRENVELIQWMRDYNADPRHRRKISFYGLDLSLGGPTGSTPTPLPIELALAYLARVDSPSAQELRASFGAWLTRLPDPGQVTRAEHDALTAAIDDLNALIERERLAYTRASGEAEYAWARRIALAAQQADRRFRQPPRGVPAGGIPPDAWRSVGFRDLAMADNAIWALDREGPDGRILVFAHNAHVMNAPITGGIWSVFERPATSMGLHLRSALGSSLLIIAGASGENGKGLPAVIPDTTGIDAALQRLGSAPLLLPLRPARAADGSPRWLEVPRTLRANFTTFLTVTPRNAMDVILYHPSLTPVHGAGLPQ